MKKETFDRETEKLSPTSVRKACFIANAYLTSKDKKYITDEEFNKAVGVLIAYSYTNSNDKTEPDLRSCGDECEKFDPDFCPGEFIVTDDETKKLCPYYKKKRY